jgi:hypothetical protein
MPRCIQHIDISYYPSEPQIVVTIKRGSDAIRHYNSPSVHSLVRLSCTVQRAVDTHDGYLCPFAYGWSWWRQAGIRKFLV